MAARRQLILAMGAGPGGMGGGMGGMRFTINGREYSEARTDTIVAAGTVEEWTLVNTSPMDHPFHLHVWPMQLIEDNGQGAGAVVMRDVVNVRANGRATVRIAFRDFTRPLGLPLPHPGPRGPGNDGRDRGPLTGETSCQTYPPGVW